MESGNKDDKWIKNLIRSIHEEIMAHQALLNKLKAQQYAIMDRDVARLFGLTEEANESLFVAKTASENRIETLRQAAAVRPSYELESIEKVIPLVRSEFAQTLQEQKQLLLSVTEEIKKTNKVTKYLLEQSLEFINQNLQMLRSETEYGGSYQADGNVARSKSVSTLSQLS